MGIEVALVGECMIELRGEAFGALHQGFGGDTLNTAVYLARCGAARGLNVHYATALGTDALSRELQRRWQLEGIATDLVREIDGRMPGLYQIAVDGRGERSFSYWRDTSAAKVYFECDLTPLEAQAARWHALYLSGITLAILPPAGRERLFALMRCLRERGAMVVFDNNYRARLWPDAETARSCFARAFELASLSLVTADDHVALFGSMGSTMDEPALLRQLELLGAPEVVVKRGSQPTLVRLPGREGWQSVPTEPVARVVDTTAAGDSFAAGYLCQRLLGADGPAAAHFGNRLAARVIAHPGALIEPAAMADLAAEADFAGR